MYAHENSRGETVPAGAARRRAERQAHPWPCRPVRRRPRNARCLRRRGRRHGHRTVDGRPHDLDQSRQHAHGRPRLQHRQSRPELEARTHETPSRSASSWSAKCATREGAADAGLRPRHHRLSACRRHRAPHPHTRPAGGLRPRGSPRDHHRHICRRTRSIEARIAIDDTLARHFAIVGTTGVGKSTAVSLLMRKAIEARPDLRVLILDPHNEFAASLPEYAVRVDATTLDLPFWMFRLEEFTEVLFRGREVGARRRSTRCATSSRWPRTSIATRLRRRLPAPRRRCADRRHAGALPHGRSDHA